MSFRPGKGRAPFIASGGGGGGVSSPLTWQETFYPEQMQTTGTAVLADQVFGSLGFINVYAMTNNVCSIFTQANFHPYYDGGNILCRVAFYCADLVPMGDRQIGVSIRTFPAGAPLFDQTIPPGVSIVKNTALPGNRMLYFPQTVIPILDIPAANNMYELWIIRQDTIASTFYIVGVQLTYNLTKRVL